MGLLSVPTNQEVVREGIIELAARRLWKDSGGRRRKRLWSAPLEVDRLRLTFVIAEDAAPDWQRLWGKLAALDWTPS